MNTGRMCRVLAAIGAAFQSLSMVLWLHPMTESSLPNLDSFLSMSKSFVPEDVKVPRNPQYFRPRVVFLSSEISRDAVDARSLPRSVHPLGRHVNGTVYEDPEWNIEPVSNRYVVHPTCNAIHEIDLLEGTFVFSQGFCRLAVRMDDLLLRPIRLSQNFTPWNYRRQEMDAAVTELLTRSPNIPNEYAFCGQTILSEFMPRTLQEKVRRKNIHPIQRLKFARDATRALADLHAIVDLAHLDVHSKNLMLKNGTAYLIDFNHAYFGTGPATISGDYGIRLGPPECTQNNCTFYDGHPQYFDLYCLGNILFEIWTRRFPYEDMDWISDTQIIQRKQKGVFPPLPEKRSDDPAITAIYEAVHACYRPNPKDRPSSAVVAHALSIAYETITKNETNRTMEDVMREMLT